MPGKLSTAVHSEATESEVDRNEPRHPLISRWVLPSIADVFFLVLFGLLVFTPMSNALLGDGDTGWHIRSGEFILTSRSVPRTDLFSYTRAGQPWYAWEWLFDAVIAAIHHVAGLNGVVLFTAFIIATTFSLLFRFVLRRSGSFALAVVSTLLAAAAAQIHMLARPHVLSWLLTLLWVEALYRFEEGKRRALLLLPPLMLLWVNLHGGFILGLALLGLFICANIWQYLSTTLAGSRQRSIDLTMAFVACGVATLCTPYGYKLHLHVYEYLSSSFLMNSIDEFMSPNFHATGFGYFEVFILLAALVMAAKRDQLSAREVFLVLFAIHAGLYAQRNIPISAILLALAAAQLFSPSLAYTSGTISYPPQVRPAVRAICDISRGMGEMEMQFKGHAIVFVFVIASLGVSANAGRLSSVQLMSAHFDETKFPAKAAQFVSQREIHDHLFNTDAWSGYLIYRLNPSLKVYFDDRHDFYGEEFIKDYIKVINANEHWREPLDKARVQWILIPTSSSLSSLLTQDSNWRIEYDDGLAIIFARVRNTEK